MVNNTTSTLQRLSHTVFSFFFLHLSVRFHCVHFISHSFPPMTIFFTTFSQPTWCMIADSTYIYVSIWMHVRFNCLFLIPIIQCPVVFHSCISQNRYTFLQKYRKQFIFGWKLIDWRIEEKYPQAKAKAKERFTHFVTWCNCGICTQHDMH